MKTAVSLLLPFLCVACVSSAPRPASHVPPAKTSQEVSSVVVTDGVDLREAQTLATAYAHRYISGCGYVGIAQRRNGCWAARVFSGYAGTPADYIRVDARTGTISYPGSPTVSAQDLH